MGGAMLRRRWFAWSSRVTLGVALWSCRPPAAPSTSTDPRVLYNSFVEAWNGHDYAALDTLIAADAIEEDLALGFRGTGPDGFKGFMRQTLAKIPDFSWTPALVMVDNFKVAAEWTLSGTYTGDSPQGQVKGRRFHIRGVSVITTNGRRITRFSNYYSLADFYRQVSGPPPVKRSR
jgi:steroid delta-isomerase-like uncharacterized protein